MKKNITNILQRGNLTPKERVLLIVHNNIKKEQTGKEILTPADKHALTEGWTPKDNNEVREYNRFNEGWIKAGFAELEAQTIFLNTELDYYRTSHINLSFAFYLKKENELLSSIFLWSCFVLNLMALVSILKIFTILAVW